MQTNRVHVLVAAAIVWGVGCGGTSPTDTEEYREIKTQLDTARAKIADLESQLDAAANSGAPSAPRGVSVVTGDGDVTVSWLSNPEEDLDGYDILRSRRASQGFAIVGSVGRASTSYADPTAENGTTYYYGVVAIDEGGNVSDRSRDRAVSTPRPQGEGIELGDIDLDPTRAGIRLSEADRGPVHWDADGDDWLDDDLDIAYWLDEEFGIPYFFSDHDDVFMQDLGFHMTLQAIDSVPTEGYTSFSTEIVEGHLYAFLTRDGNYAKVRVTDVAAEAVTFDWAYQTVEDNPNVAPARNPRVVAAGRRRAQ